MPFDPSRPPPMFFPQQTMPNFVDQRRFLPPVENEFRSADRRRFSPFSRTTSICVPKTWTTTTTISISTSTTVVALVRVLDLHRATRNERVRRRSSSNESKNERKHFFSSLLFQFDQSTRFRGLARQRDGTARTTSKRSSAAERGSSRRSVVRCARARNVELLFFCSQFANAVARPSAENDLRSRSARTIGTVRRDHRDFRKTFVGAIRPFDAFSLRTSRSFRHAVVPSSVLKNEPTQRDVWTK